MASSPLLMDWTSERLRAWAFVPGASARSVPLDGNDATLPLVVSMAERKLQVGKTAQTLVRRQPHQVAERFLPYLGLDRLWQHGRHAIDSREALVVVLNKIKDKLPSKSLFHVVPSYWNREQAALFEDQTRQAGYRCLGTIKRGLALAGFSPGITIDVDSFAVSITHTRQQSRSGGLQLEHVQSLTDLAMPIWCERIAAQVANRCLRDCRRDPRAHPETDQQLHDQLLDRVYDWAGHQDARLELRHRDWQSDINLTAEEALAACHPLAYRLAQHVLAKPDAEGWYLSPEAARLPGVPQALYQGSRNQRSLSVLPAELLPQTLSAWVTHIDQGVTSPPIFSDVLPVVSEGRGELAPDTLPFHRRQRKE